MKKLMRITLAALLLSVGAPQARPGLARPVPAQPGAAAPSEFVRRAATAAGDQFTLASSRYSNASWRKLLLAQSREQDSSGSIGWYQPVWSADELRIGMRGLTMDLQQRRNSAERCSAYLQ